MMTRSQTRIAELENQVESMTQVMVDGMYHFDAQIAELQEHFKDSKTITKKLQAYIVELKKENEKLEKENEKLEKENEKLKKEKE